MKSSTTVRASLPAVLSLALILAADPARGAGETRASASSNSAATVAQLNEEGAALYGARDYRRAIEKFIQAYAVDSDPNLLFNIARCYEELGEVDAAIEKYEAFLELPGADARGRQRARDSLQALRASKQSAGTAASVSSDGADGAGGEAEQLAARVSPEEGSSVLPWLTLGGSIAFAAVGTTFYLMGASDHDRVTSADGYGDPNGVSPMTRREADDLASSGDTKKLIGGIGFGVAGALAVTYVVLLLTEGGEPVEQAQPSLGWSVSPARGGAAVSVQGSF